MTDVFASLAEAHSTQGPAAVLDRLIEVFRERGEFNRLFEARLMKKRHELGLPLIPEGPAEDLGPAQKAYDQTMLEAARETANLYLAAGKLAEAWPFFRALGEAAPLREAIDRLPPEDAEDPVIEIALSERLHPSKGFEFLLKRHGICRAITFFEQYPDPATREQSLALLSETLYNELAANLRAAIERAEGSAPEAMGIRGLIEGRDWLFGEYSYHVDLSHLMSVVRLSSEAEDPGILARGLEMAEYGSRLHSTLSYRGDPPFEDFFRDSAIYLRARTGVEVEEAIAHFRAKVASYDYEQMSTYPAQTFVRMLLRLHRPQLAIEIFEEFLGDTNPAYLSCPPLAQLCRIAGDYERLKQLARREGDLVQYSAALIAENTSRR
jgi:hypothetical protein